MPNSYFLGGGMLGNGIKTSRQRNVSIDFSTLADGALPGQLTGATWAIVGGKAVNTPTVGAEMVTDGNMEAAGVTSWVSSGSPTTKEKSTTQKHGGAQSLHIITAGNGVGARTSALTTSTNVWYRVSGWVYAVAGGKATFGHSITANLSLSSTAASWVQKTLTRWELAGGTRYARCLVDTAEGYYDDVSFAPITRATMFAAANDSTADGIAKAGWIIPEGVQAGVALNIDDTSNPQNFVLCFVNRVESSGATIYLVKCVGGTLSEVYTGSITYGAGKVIELRKSGNTYKVYYDDVQIGADQTISDAGIVSNKKHALFSTDVGAQANGFFFGATIMTEGLVYAGSSITYATGAGYVVQYASYRNLSASYLRDRYVGYDWDTTNSAVPGANTWNNLWRLPTDVLAHSPALVIWDPTNSADNEHCHKAIEAFIRRIYTAYPSCKMLVVLFPAIPAYTDIALATPDNAGMVQVVRDLATHYGFPCVDYYAYIQDQVANHGVHVADVMLDTVHPNEAGHTLVYNLVAPQLPALMALSTQAASPLPAAIYDTAGDYQHEPQLIDGTSYANRTGTWTNVGTEIDSSEVGATATFTVTASSFGIEPPSGYTNPAVTYRVNGGAWDTGTPDTDGMLLGARGSYTVDIKVAGGTVKIKRFLAI